MNQNPNVTTKSPTDSDKKFETSNKSVLRIWDEIQRVQTDFCFAQEISAYYMSDDWVNNARLILDVGTGNGYFLSLLQKHFPDKDYTGIDFSKELIDIAKSNICSPNIHLNAQDYFSITGVYDFVIMRLFWQHLPSISLTDALNKLAEITKPGSCVLICDAYDESRLFVPDLPEFKKVITAYTHHQTTLQRNRNITATLLDWVQSTTMWQVGCNIPLILPSSIPGNLDRYKRIYELWIELFECLGELSIDFTPAKEELACWMKKERAYTQAGLRVIRLDRIT